jgi:DNA-binding transcriptional ArsR family regulator
MNPELAETAALLSDPGRASILMALLGGVALPAGQLAMIANVAPQTASSHLSKLVSGNLLAVEQQGRHRYYRLADIEVENAIEALLAVTARARKIATDNGKHGAAGTIAYARTCYSHLAGHLAVEITDALQKRELLVAQEPKTYRVTAKGHEWFRQLGIPISEGQLKQPQFARKCLDWTERRHHLAGRLGSAVLARFRELEWIAPLRDTRAVRVTLEGRRRLPELLGVAA